MNKDTFRSLWQAISRLAIAVVVIFATAVIAYSQTQITTGTIEGTVTDENGAVVPGATVEIKNLDTNASRTFWLCSPAIIRCR